MDALNIIIDRYTEKGKKSKSKSLPKEVKDAIWNTQNFKVLANNMFTEQELIFPSYLEGIDVLDWRATSGGKRWPSDLARAACRCSPGAR